MKRTIAGVLIASIVWTAAGLEPLAAAEQVSVNPLAAVANAPAGLRVRIERPDATITGDIVTVAADAVTLENARAEAGSPSIPADRRLTIRSANIRKVAVVTRDYKASRGANPDLLRFVARSMFDSGRKVELKTASGSIRGKLTEVGGNSVSIARGSNPPINVPLTEVRELKPAGMPRAVKATIVFGVGAFALIMLGLLAASAENSG